MVSLLYTACGNEAGFAHLSLLLLLFILHIDCVLMSRFWLWFVPFLVAIYRAILAQTISKYLWSERAVHTCLSNMLLNIRHNCFSSLWSEEKKEHGIPMRCWNLLVHVFKINICLLICSCSVKTHFGIYSAFSHNAICNI